MWIACCLIFFIPLLLRDILFITLFFPQSDKNIRTIWSNRQNLSVAFPCFLEEHVIYGYHVLNASKLFITQSALSLINRHDSNQHHEHWHKERVWSSVAHSIDDTQTCLIHSLHKFVIFKLRLLLFIREHRGLFWTVPLYESDRDEIIKDKLKIVPNPDLISLHNFLFYFCLTILSY